MNLRNTLARYGLVALVLVPATGLAWGDGCKFTADRAAGIDAKGVEKVVIRAGAGDMKVVGRGTAVRIEARGVTCAAKQELLDRTQLSVRREGNTVYVETGLPQDETGWSWGNNEYAYIDVGIALPANIPVDATDSSGDAEFEDLGALTVQDSSGDLEVRRIAGLADISDSSGDLDVTSAGGVRLRDSSGDIELEDIRGDVDVEQDSSGDIEVANVGGSVRVRQDSSGSIRIEDVKGSVNVDSDSSGDIYAGRVTGDFIVSEDSSGSIGHESIGGRVTVPSNKRNDDDVE
jgi:DUF4097 and DUF4098 domain-containing protein YvlB